MMKIFDIDEAWDEFLATIQLATDTARQSTDNPFERAERYKFIQSGITSMWKSMGYPDRSFPLLAEFNSPVYDFGSTTPEYFYQTVHIEPEGVYRIWGNRGTASYIDLSQNAQWFGESEAGGVNKKGDHSEVIRNDSFDEVIQVDANGYFDFIWSVEKPDSGDWWPRHPRTRTLFTRNILVDWENELPWDINIARIDTDQLTPGRRTPEEATLRLRQQASMLSDFSRVCMNFPQTIADKTGYNQFARQSFENNAGHLDQVYWFLTMRTKPGEALLLEWDVSTAESILYWDIVLNNSTWACLDYRTIQCSLNNAQAEIGKDGIFRAIVSPDDPGVSNWLDTNHGEAAMVMLRAKRCPGICEPEIRLLPQAEAIAELAGRLSMVNSGQRKEQLSKRRIDYDRRYRGLQ